MTPFVFIRVMYILHYGGDSMFKQKEKEEIKQLVYFGIAQWAVIILIELVYLFTNI